MSQKKKTKKIRIKKRRPIRGITYRTTGEWGVGGPALAWEEMDRNFHSIDQRILMLEERCKHLNSRS